MPTEKQLTAMQQLIAFKDQTVKDKGSEISAYQLLIMIYDKADELLTTERQQLIDAVNYGGNYYDGTKLMAENYYNETFKTQ